MMDSKTAVDLVRRYLGELRLSISEPSSLAMDLYCYGVIPRSVYNEAISSDREITKERKIQSICDALLQEVAVKPALLVLFVRAASDHSPAMKDVCQRISKEPFYVELEKFVLMKRATKHGREARVGGEGSAKHSVTQVYQVEPHKMMPATSSGDQLQATLHSPPPKEIRYEVPFKVKRKFEILQNRFGAVFVRTFKLIKEEDLESSKNVLAANFPDIKDKLKDLESVEELQELVLCHTSFVSFPMLECLVYHFNYEESEKELVSFTEFKNKIYSKILAEDLDFAIAGIDECVKDPQTKMVLEVRWARNFSASMLFEDMMIQALENAGIFVQLNVCKGEGVGVRVQGNLSTQAEGNLSTLVQDNLSTQVQDKVKFLKEILGDAIREMGPATGDSELTALQAEIISILNNTFEFDDKGIQQLRQKMHLLKACVQRKRGDQPRLKMEEVRMSLVENSQIAKLTADLERAKQENEEKVEFLKETLSDAIREMSPATADPELTALQAKIISILSSTSEFDSKAIQELKERMSQLKVCVQRTRNDEHRKIANHDQIVKRREMEVKMSHAKNSEISRITAELEDVKQEKETKQKDLEDMEKLFLAKKKQVSILESDLQSKEVEISKLCSSVQETKLLSEILCDISREMASSTGDPELTALQEDIVSVLGNTPSEFDGGRIQQLRQKMHLFIACIQRRRGDQPRFLACDFPTEVKMLQAKNIQISKLTADLERANEENAMKKKDLEHMEKLFLAKKEKVSILETDLQSKEVENSKLHSSLQARDQRIATLEPRLRAKEEQLIAALNTEKKQCSDAAVQANYLAVTEFGLKGVEVSGEKIFEVTADSFEKYKWDSHGFQLTVPNGALPPGVTATVAVRSIVAGPFELPQDSELVGAIYWISSTHIFKKKVTVHLQHCAIISTEAECSHFKIIIGKCSQDPPYTFAMKDGVFTPHSQSASISVTQFSIFGTVYRFCNWLGIAQQPVQRQYVGLIFHKKMSHTVGQISLVVVQDVLTLVEYVKKECCEFTVSYKFPIEFEEKSESINIEMFPDEEELWCISSMDSQGTMISKRAVDNYQVDNYQGRQTTIPRCDFLAKWQSQTGAVKNHLEREGRVELTQKNYSPRIVKFVVNFSPEPTQGFATPAPNVLDSFSTQDQGTYCQQGDFVNKVAAKIPAAWFNFGISLGINFGKLEAVEQSYPTNPQRCFMKVYSIWEQERVQPLTWEVVVEILKSKIVGQSALSSDLATEYNLQ